MLIHIFKKTTLMIVMKYKDIAQFMYENEEPFTSIRQKSLVFSYIGSNSKQEKAQVYNLVMKIQLRYKRCSSNYERFLAREKKWISTNFQLKESLQTQNPKKKIVKPVKRKKRTFNLLGKGGKNNRIRELRDEYDPEAIKEAIIQFERQSGNMKMVRLLKQIFKDQSQIDGLLAVLDSKPSFSETNTVPTEAATSFLLMNDISKKTYLNIRDISLRYGLRWPSYQEIILAKESCRPSKDHLTVTSDSAIYQPIEVVRHTLDRIIDSDVLEMIKRESSADGDRIHLDFVLKAGMDGTSGLELYKQTRSDDATTSEQNEQSLLVSHIMPLLLRSKNEHNLIYFQADKPSSRTSCRPLALKFKKENQDSVVEEYERMTADFESNQVFEIVINGEHGRLTLVIHLTVLMVMVDGKIINLLTNNSSQRCVTCKAGPKELMNPNGDFTAIPHCLRFGLSILHFSLNSFRNIMNIAVRLDFKERDCRGEERKAKRDLQHERICIEFKQKLNLVIDVPKTGGFGTTTDGNSCRKAFENAEVFAEITNVDVGLISRIWLISIAISTRIELCPNKFKSFCDDTRLLYHELYSWYPMCPSMHRVLVHGHEFIREVTAPIGLSIGYTSEEPLESTNRLLKYFRLHRTRKDSRTHTMTDWINRLMDTSDPRLHQYGKTSGGRSKQYPDAVRNMFKIPNV